MERLFALPEYDNAFADFVHKAIHELMRRKDPLLSRVRVDYSEQILIVCPRVKLLRAARSRFPSLSFV